MFNRFILSQKWQLGLPDHFLLMRLSFVYTALLVISHMKILIFWGTLPFHIILLDGPASLLVKALYKDFTENFLFFSNFNNMTSSVFWSSKFWTSVWIRFQQVCNSEVSHLLNVICILPFFISATLTFFLLTENEQNRSNVINGLIIQPWVRSKSSFLPIINLNRSALKV